MAASPPGTRPALKTQPSSCDRALPSSPWPWLCSARDMVEKARREFVVQEEDHDRALRSLGVTPTQYALICERVRGSGQTLPPSAAPRT